MVLTKRNIEHAEKKYNIFTPPLPCPTLEGDMSPKIYSAIDIIFMFSYSGEKLLEAKLDGTVNVDWEDLAIIDTVIGE